MKGKAQQVDPMEGPDRFAHGIRFVPSPWLKTEQARAYLQISDTKLRKLIASGEIPSVQRGNTKFVHASDLDAYMMSLPSGAAPIAMAARSA